MDLATGTRLGPYEIQSALGAGGMGNVYKARDTRLGRTVAIKVLHQPVSGDAARKLLREGRATARLNHPNIAALYDVVDLTDQEPAISFLVMEYVDGESLAARLAAGPCDIDRALTFTIEVLDALAYAHGQGVIHRDVKPANVMVTRDGHVKLLDLGVAQLVAGDPSAMTRTATDLPSVPARSGTPAYMAPEQMVGQPATPQSDIYSVGVLLYEILTGRRPFGAPDMLALAMAVASQPTPSLRDVRPDVPPALDAFVARAMAKDPSARFTSADELRDEVVRVRDAWRGTTSARTVVVPPPRWTPRRIVIGTLGAVAIATVAIFAWVAVGHWRAPAIGGPMSIAILPFTNIGNDPANQPFSDGLVEVLTSQLTQIGRAGGLEVVPASDQRSQRVISARDARSVFGVSHVITGSVERTATRARVTINLVDAKTTRQLDARSIDLELGDVVAMQDGVVRKVAELVGASLRPEAERALAVGGTTVPGAYDAYLQARGYLRRYDKIDTVELAIGSFQRAVQLDPRYALAHAGLGEAYWRKYQISKDAQWADLARASGTTARGLADSAPLRVTLGVIEIGTGRSDDAVTDLQEAIRLDPQNADAYRELANAYRTLGKVDDAERTYRAAIDVRPNYWANYNELAKFYLGQRRNAEAETQFQRVVDLTPDSEQAYRNLGAAYLALKRADLAEQMFLKSAAIKPNGNAYSNLGFLYFKQGRYTEAARTFEKAAGLENRDSKISSNLASALYWAPGERDKARPAYERALALTDTDRRVNPTDVTLILRMADCESRLGHAAHARQLIDEAIALPTGASFPVKIASVYEQIGDRKHALDWIQKAIDGGSRDDVEQSPDLAQLRADPRYPKK